MIARITDWILSLSGGWALLVVFLGPALESSAFIGFLFPGEIAVLLGGVLAFDGRVGLVAAIVAAVSGAIVGDTVGYWVGNRWGHQILRWIARRVRFLEHRVERHLGQAREFLRRRGGMAVVVGRFTAALRVMVPGLAGMSEMHYPTFLLFNALGGAIWGSAFVLLGFFAGAAWERAAGYAAEGGLVLLALVILGLVTVRVLRNVREGGETIPNRLARMRPVAWLRRTFPGTSAWLADRVDTSTPRGFVLSLLVSAGAFSLWLFGALTQDVVAHEEMTRFDPGVLRFALAHRRPWLTDVMRTVTWLGSNGVLVPLALSVAAWLVWRRRAWAPASAIVVALAGASLTTRVVGAIVARPRPPLAARLVDVTMPAFPSGHAAQAVAVWGALAVAFAADRDLRTRVLAALAAAVLILSVGSSRIYLGVHWMTDVLAGFAVGAVWLCLVGAALCVRSTRRTPDARTGGIEQVVA